MPGVLILEAMAQTGGFLVLNSIPNPETKLMYFSAINESRFKKIVIPGDQVIFEVKLSHFAIIQPRCYKLYTILCSQVCSSCGSVEHIQTRPHNWRLSLRVV